MSEVLDVKLRPLVLSDDVLTFKWRSSDRAKLLNQGAQTVEDQRKWIDKSIKDLTQINFVIMYKSIPVGMIALLDIDTYKSVAQAGRLIIGEDEFCRGKQVVCDVLILLYEYAFLTLKLKIIYGHIDKRNTLMQKFHKFTGVKIINDEKFFFDKELFKIDFTNIEITQDDYQKVIKSKLLNLRKIGL